MPCEVQSLVVVVGSSETNLIVDSAPALTMIQKQLSSLSEMVRYGLTASGAIPKLRLGPIVITHIIVTASRTNMVLAQPGMSRRHPSSVHGSRFGASIL
uniref:Uncharacterized protein n=1 Tax=Physcomitrium patens TaxID=3218 RepID=A0A2K1K1S8_PHYPA|nr:hypothetical protein PHYPA_012207 [Physcomitrium patens]